MIVRRDFDFEASHQLPNHPGRCRRLHGHSYRLRVACRAAVDPRTGIAIDFADLKHVVRTHVLEALDHTHLNDLLPLPSAENIVAWIWDRLAAQGLPLFELVLWESPGCSVAYHGPDAEPPAAPGRP
ncbi:MAG: 6-carboxytetrahydropterin synthase QueD [Planctomycetia bacterium]